MESILKVGACLARKSLVAHTLNKINVVKSSPSESFCYFVTTKQSFFKEKRGKFKQKTEKVKLFLKIKLENGMKIEDFGRIMKDK